jgi:sugar/nucleoside kinase (ribokinase family)
MSNILVIGCVSFDTIHLEHSAGLQGSAGLEQGAERKTYNTVGGAALFTALAAAHMGAEVTLYAPKPSPMPGALRAVDNAVTWIGPEVDPDKMPTLEIIHHGDGSATLLAASWGPEQLLMPDALKSVLVSLQPEKAAFDIIHIAALSSPVRQLEFLQFFIDTGVTSRVSVGTYARAISSDRKTVLQLLKQCDMFFMNNNEANLLFESGAIQCRNDQLVFVTDGKYGALVHTANSSEHIEALPADELDPTGAGDTFCGATLAALANQLNAEQAASLGGLASQLNAGEAASLGGLASQLNAGEAASLGAQLAARVIEQPGSDFYF